MNLQEYLLLNIRIPQAATELRQSPNKMKAMRLLRERCPIILDMNFYRHMYRRGFVEGRDKDWQHDELTHDGSILMELLAMERSPKTPNEQLDLL